MAIRLTQIGLEWDDGERAAGWMPFACMRLICIAPHRAVRISGPPGHVWLRAGELGNEQFYALMRASIEGARKAGCSVRVKVNTAPPVLGFLWARTGRSLKSDGELEGLLEEG